MPPDRKDPGATWQGPVNSSVNQYGGFNDPASSSNEPVEYNTGNDENVSNQQASWQVQEQESQPSSPEQPVAYEDNASVDAPLSLRQLLRRSLLLVLVPLVFALLTSVIVLPAIANNQAKLAPTAFWPVLLVIVAIAIAQGLFFYFTTNEDESIRIAGFENGRWIPGVAAGFCLFIVILSFVFFGPLPGLFILLALIIAGIILFQRCFHPIPEGSVALVYAFKKYTRTMYPGFNILFPWEKVRVQLRSMEVMWMCPTQVVQLSRDEDVALSAVISYQLVPEDAYLAVTQVQNWEESLRQFFTTALQSIGDYFVPQDFLPWAPESYEQNSNSGNDNFMGGASRRARINEALFNLMRDRVALWGVQINRVDIRDIELMPHEARLAETLKSPDAPAATQPAQENRLIAATPQTPPTPTPQPAPQAPTNPPAPQPVSRPPQQNPSPAQPAQPVSRPPVVHAETQLHYASPNETTEEAPRFSPQALNEDVLVKAYQAVKNEQVTDPEAIREIATRFEAVARDPQLSQSVSFDPARAALILYDQARKKEEAISVAHVSSAQPDWIARQPNDDNMMVGG
jgi:regulator of protease activity HflC (stomatin/prohibitin superfamily)